MGVKGHDLDGDAVIGNQRGKTSFTDEELARICHEAVRAIQVIDEDSVPAQPWDSGIPDHRDATIEMVRSIRYAGSSTGEVVTPLEVHERWVGVMLADGWTLGPKNTEGKTHPSLVPYEQLPFTQRARDAVFIAVVTELDGLGRVSA